MTFFAWKAPRAIRKVFSSASVQPRATEAASLPAARPAVTRSSIPVPQIQPIILNARPGAPERPAVRIFLGTEPAQHRAERIFVYALEQVRNPDRRYEIYRMTGLPGFDQRSWRTNFTNYRFAIPDLAGRQGRAIYNDVDQLYTDDPAALFDQPMGEHGYLALSPNDTAVMLIDCERMATCWNFDTARRDSKKSLHAQAAAKPGCWGPLDPVWHARDLEYQHGVSKLLHYTTLHLQPWRPTPDQYSYQIHPYAEYFLSLEQTANATGYELYTSAKPSPGFAQACAAMPKVSTSLSGEVIALAQALEASRYALVDKWTQSAPDDESLELWRFDQLREPDLAPQDVVAASGLEALPVEDMPWIVDRLFALGRKLVYLKTGLGPADSMIGTLDGWRALLRRIASRYPDRCWQLDCTDAAGQVHCYRADFPWRVRHGDGQPTVWVLLGKHAGDNAQLVSIAESLGWPYECKSITFKPLDYIPQALQQRRLAHAAQGLKTPWPDLVLSSGRRTAPVAQWIRQQSNGKVKLVVIGRPRTPLAHFDLVLTTPQYSLPLRENTVDLPVPFITKGTVERRELDAWQKRFAHLPRPWVALLVGGSSAPYVLDTEAAGTLGRQASEAVSARGGSLLVSTSPRTGQSATESLLAAIEAPAWQYRFGVSDENPYQALLALADAFIVTGESVSMLTEAALTGKPVAVFPLPVRRHAKARLHHALERKLGIIDRAAGSRGTPRQQNKVGRFYDELVAQGRVKRERRIEEVHIALGLTPLPGGLDHVPTLSPALIAASRARAIEAIRAVLMGEQAMTQQATQSWTDH
ncbi:mitochondrial fission ELM1 family protein [Pseudomonas duriflava]|nr:mitochondrial fission ELM1 family protein [Pseudomonas duriflava]